MRELSLGEPLNDDDFKNWVTEALREIERASHEYGKEGSEAVSNAASNVNPLMDGTAAPGTGTSLSREDHVHPTDTSRAPLNSPVFTGDPRAPNPAGADNDTSIATTSWVNTAIAAAITAGTTGFVLLAGNQTITGGYKVTPFNLGNITSFTINPVSGNYQYGTNHGAATWTAPANDCAVDILVTNDASAGAITFSGFTVASGNTGDALTTTNGHKFIISIRRINGVSTYLIKALQ